MYQLFNSFINFRLRHRDPRFGENSFAKNQLHSKRYYSKNASKKYILNFLKINLNNYNKKKCCLIRK